MQKPQPSQSRVSRRDIAEIAIGACVMAFPIAVTEEVWDLGEELSLLRAGLIAVASILFLGLMIHLLYPAASATTNRKVYLHRLMATYGFTFLIAALLLLGIDRFDLFGAPLVSIKRAILVAFPASFAATVVDSFQ